MFSNHSGHGGNSDESPQPRRFNYGVSATSKSISKTPAQDRLSRFRKTLSDNIKGPQIKSQMLIQSLQAGGLVNKKELPQTITSLATASSSSENASTSPNFDRYTIRKSLGLSKNNTRPEYLKSATTKMTKKCLVPPVELCELLRARKDGAKSNTTTAETPSTKKDKAAPPDPNSTSRKRKSVGITNEIHEKVIKKSAENELLLSKKEFSNQPSERDKIKKSKTFADRLLRRAKKSLWGITETKPAVEQMELDDDNQFRMPEQSSEVKDLKVHQEDSREKENKPGSDEQRSAQQQPLRSHLNESAADLREKDNPEDEDVIMSPPKTVNTASLFQSIREGIKSAFESYINIKTQFHCMTKETQCETQRLDAQCIYVVPDTNIFLQHLTFIKELVEEPIQNNVKAVIYVPYVVVEELDKLKEQKGRSVSTLAQRAIKYLNEKLEKRDKSIRGQTVMESIRELIPIKRADDSILNCCLQLKELELKFIILSNDINLRNKALVNNIRAYASLDVESGNLSKFL